MLQYLNRNSISQLYHSLQLCLLVSPLAAAVDGLQYVCNAAANQSTGNRLLTTRCDNTIVNDTTWFVPCTIYSKVYMSI